MASRLFDLVIVVDWSARSAPATGADSIWLHEREVATGAATAPHNPRTRRAAEALLRERLTLAAGRRVLLAIDVALGYPAGFAAHAGLDRTRPAWEATWRLLTDELVDDARNRNNRWAVAAALNARIGTPQFWGCPPAQAGPHLTVTKPVAAPLPHLRHTEVGLRSHSGGAPLSVWQLLGAGAVGSQSLTAIPVLQRLRSDPEFGGRLRVWPFETGFSTAPALDRSDAIVTVEVWPSMISLDPTHHPVKDAQQVVGLSERLAQLDRDGHLAVQFAPAMTDSAAAAAAVAEEGWVLHAPLF